MASTSSTSPDTPVTLKVYYEGSTRRFKLPLRDLGITTLEDKLRTFLAVPAGADCIFERYSDSAASYVILEQKNISVYKQLYRAAKAKQKLKLRVTRMAEEEQPKAPKPVTVEDEPEMAEIPKAASSVPSLIPAASSIIAQSPAAEGSASVSVSASAQLARHEDEVARELKAFANSVIQKYAEGPEQVLPIRQAETVKPSNEIPVTVTPAARGCTRGNARWAPSPARSTFAVCCNACERTIPDAHYHCSTCEDGDFDLCQSCVDLGVTCKSPDHWLIKRFVTNGVIFSSVTETIAPKPKPKPMPQPEEAAKEAVKEAAKEASPHAPLIDVARLSGLLLPELLDLQNKQPASASATVRTCNSCVQEFAEQEFLHCTSCEDFDLCKTCFIADKHGHHPKHGFEPAVEGTTFPREITKLLAPGRHKRHSAICDGCDKFILGVRHKCLDCPDWDYCGDCVANAGFVHPGHRFVPIYDPVRDVRSRAVHPTHFGICCDGPLCQSGRNAPAYIVGDRYKCAVCDDTDFCANCEASPANTHNKTHPLIKFKTPVRHVSVTTTGEHQDGQRMPSMGDRHLRDQATTTNTSRALQTTPPSYVVSAAPVQTVVDVQPTESATSVEAEEQKIKEEEAEVKAASVLEKAPAAPTAEDLVAIYERDTIADGTVLPPNHVFQQTWVLRNAGTIPWPAGCSVKFVGGDYMGHVDPKHPAGIHELVSASESTVCYEPLAPGQEFPFTVLLRTPAREGKVISYWRLTTQDAIKFGNRLWCDVDVQAPQVKEEPTEAAAPSTQEVEEASPAPQPEASQMIFPKLEKESPVASIHQETKTESEPSVKSEEVDDFEDCIAEDDEWAEEDSDDGFMTDEEYDILDASDEESFEHQQKPQTK